MAATAFDFYLPSELNATHPPERRGIRRDHVKMMVLNKQTGNVRHDQFFKLADYLKPGDLVVMNNSRTVPAILQAGLIRSTKQIHSEVEIRLARRRNEEIWDVLIVTDEVNLGDILHFSPDLTAVVIDIRKESPLKTILFSKKEQTYLIVFMHLGNQFATNISIRNGSWIIIKRFLQASLVPLKCHQREEPSAGSCYSTFSGRE